MTQEKLAAINTRVQDLQSEILELQTRRDRLAVDYSQGNKSAIKECAQIDTAQDAAKREMGLLQTAIAKLTELAEEEQQEILDKVEEQRQTKAADFAESICDTNAAIDA